jgi:hypothetical protein
MLLDTLMPRFDFVERHAAEVRASPTAVHAAIRDADLAGGPLTRSLLALRAVPGVLLMFVRSPRQARAAWRRPGRRVRLADFERVGFRVVAERIPDEIVIGVLGRFWTLRGSLRRDVSDADFRRGPPRGFALAGWNFTATPRADGGTDLATETRVWCAPDARWQFGMYWLFVRPGSGLIRRAMLRSIRRHAERQSETVGAAGRRVPNDADSRA